MHFVLLTEFESSRETTCKIMNLPLSELDLIEEHFRKLQIVTHSYFAHNMLEVDVMGVQLLAKLSEIHYKVIGQSMIMEQTVIGGSTVKTQKIVWTLAKE